jgi:hypothetical protein
VNVDSARSFSGETAREIGCTVQTLNGGGNLGFHSTCLFGYPLRQFLLPALPTLIFGTSLLNLNLLGGAYFLLGTIIFAGGVIRNFRSAYMGNLIAALLLSVFLQVYFWNHFYLLFEQSIFPLSFTLILGGLVLYYRVGDARALPLIGIVLLWLIGAYTPALAVYGLALGGLGYLALSRRQDAESLLLIMALTFASLLVSLGYRHDINIGAGSNPALGSDLWQGLQHLVYQNQGVPWTTPLLVLPLIAFVALALAWQWGPLSFAVAAWVVAVFVFAVAAHGYAVYSVDFRLHRALVVVPVLITTGALLLRRRRLARLRSALEVLLLVSLVVGVKYHLDYRQSVSPPPGLPFVTWLRDLVPDEGTQSAPLTMTWMPNGNQDLSGATDALVYYSPHLQTVFLAPEQVGPGCPGLKGLRGLILAQTSAPCFGTLQEEARTGLIHYLGTYPTTTMRLDLFRTAQ